MTATSSAFNPRVRLRTSQEFQRVFDGFSLNSQRKVGTVVEPNDHEETAAGAVLYCLWALVLRCQDFISTALHASG